MTDTGADGRSWAGWDATVRGADPPLTVEALADLQAGLLDDDTAARLRKQVRADPDARQTMDALNRVRHDIAALGADAASAPDVAPEVVDRIAATLRAQRPDRSRRAPRTPSRRGRLPRSTRVAVGGGRSGRGRRRGLAGNRRPDHGAGTDAEQADHRRTHHRVDARR